MDFKGTNNVVGYIRVADLDDQQEIRRQLDLIFDHCRKNDLKAVVSFADQLRISENFSGDGWKDLEKVLKMADGKISAVIIPEPHTLTRDISLMLLKQHELRGFGVSIEIAEGHGPKQSKVNNLTLN